MEKANAKDIKQENINDNNNNNKINFTDNKFSIKEKSLVYPNTARESLKKAPTINPDWDYRASFDFEQIDSINLKLRRLTTVKDSPWTMKNFPKEKIISYDFILDYIKSLIEAKNPNALKSDNFRIVLRIHKNDNFSSLTITNKEDWERLFGLRFFSELKNFIGINRNMNIYTLKIEYDLQDFNKKFNECASKCDLQNKIIDNLFSCILNNEKIKKGILDNLYNNILKDKHPDKYAQELTKKHYSKLLQDYTEKVYDTLLNNLKNFKSLQEDLNKLNLETELDFYTFDDLEENNQDNSQRSFSDTQDKNKFYNINKFLNENKKGDSETENLNNLDDPVEPLKINFRSSYNVLNHEELISRLIIETKKSIKK